MDMKAKQVAILNEDHVIDIRFFQKTARGMPR